MKAKPLSLSRLKHSILPIALLFTAFEAQAALVASYVDGTDADAAALTNLAGPITGIATVTDLSNVGFEVGNSITRSEFGLAPSTPAGPTAGSSTGSEWLFARDSVTQDIAGTTTDYFGFTVTADVGETLGLTNLKFDFVARANQTAAYGTYSTQVFYAADGGSFVSIGSPVSSEATASNVWAPLTSADIDLSTITGANSFEFRIGIGDGGLNTVGGAAWVQGIQLNAVAIPEPSSYALIGGLLALGCVVVRRRRRVAQ